MRLKVLVPHDVVLDEPVERVVAEADNGFFCLLPRHIDFVAALCPGVLYFTPQGGGHGYVAIDDGVLVKCADEVSVSVLRAARGDDLERLAALVREEYLARDEHERQARTALARLEAGTLRRFRDLQVAGRG